MCPTSPAAKDSWPSWRMQRSLARRSWITSTKGPTTKSGCGDICWAIGTGCKNTNFSQETHQPCPHKKINKKIRDVQRNKNKARKRKEKKCRVQTKKKERKHIYLQALGVCTPVFVDHFNAVPLTVASHTGRPLLLWTLK